VQAGHQDAINDHGDTGPGLAAFREIGAELVGYGPEPRIAVAANCHRIHVRPALRLRR
jgi:hypothetical protein